MKVLIAYPALGGPLSPMLTQNRQFQWYHVPSFIYPLIPATAATLLAREGFEVLWHDGIAAGATQDDFDQLLERNQPDLVVLETKTPVIRRHWALTARIKQILPGARVALFGDHVTARPRETLEHSPADFAICGGDVDVSLLGLCRHLADRAKRPPGLHYRRGKQIRSSGPFVLCDDLDVLPFPDRTLTHAERYGEKWRRFEPFFYTLAGRDCPWHRCTFCAWTVTHPRFRVRSVDNLLAEIGELETRYGAREIFDDTGTFPRGKWLRRLCEGLIAHGFHRRLRFGCNFRFDWLTPGTARRMHAAGFRKLKIGLESANAETLRRLDKGTTPAQIEQGCRAAARAGLDVHLTVMLGFPWEDLAAVERTYELTRKLMRSGWVEMLQATIAVPYPGTRLHEEALEQGWLAIDPEDWDAYDMSRPILRTPADVGPQTINELAARTYRLHFDPRYVAHRVLKLRRPEDLRYALRGVKSMAGHVRDFLRGTG